ncbi:phosphopantetheine-binding protein [Rhodococcus sp. AQ5-07]|uniref:phosphopantetheine-binding protein n=1 Tax=Rhodococcus sp. AQ5-07 TaxID=2054902 RepID=UPI0013B42FE7|nr:phosphopantetheine-binding protein [Rhodococcus sp. AQ5-07]
MSNESVTSALDRILRVQLPNIGDAVVIDQHEPLSRFGLDSLGMVQVAIQLEHQFDMVFPDGFLTAETFETPAALVAAVATLRPDLDTAS